MPRNSVMDLNNILFEQIERLSDESLTKEELKTEIERTKAITSVSNEIVKNAQLALNAQHFIAETNGRSNVELPAMLDHKKLK